MVKPIQSNKRLFARRNLGALYAVSKLQELVGLSIAGENVIEMNIDYSLYK